METMKKLFENGNLFDYVLNESSSSLKESNALKITFKTIEDALHQWYEYQLDFNSNFSKERTEEAYNDICNIIKESESVTFNLINKIIHKIEWYGYDSWQFKKNIYSLINESSSALKESECSLERLLANAYVSDYKMGSKNSALVRVRTSPALLTSDSMAARFEEDIPDGYRLEVEYLGEDPILGNNLDIYEVQLLKN